MSGVEGVGLGVQVAVEGSGDLTGGVVLYFPQGADDVRETSELERAGEVDGLIEERRSRVRVVEQADRKASRAWSRLTVLRLATVSGLVAWSWSVSSLFDGSAG